MCPSIVVTRPRRFATWTSYANFPCLRGRRCEATPDNSFHGSARTANPSGLAPQELPAQAWLSLTPRALRDGIGHFTCGAGRGQACGLALPESLFSAAGWFPQIVKCHPSGHTTCRSVRFWPAFFICPSQTQLTTFSF